MKFKNIGTIDLGDLTAREHACSNIGVGQYVRVMKHEVPLNKKNVRNIHDDYTLLYRRLNKMLTPDIYMIVKIEIVNCKLVNSAATYADPYRHTSIRMDNPYDAYFLVKKRNYNKYIAQCLTDEMIIDYVYIKSVKEFDYAIDLGIIDII